MTDYNYEAAAIHLLGEPKKKQGDELNYFNPLAPDGKNPDFYVNIKTGAYNSFSSDHTGHFTELYAKQKDIDTKQAFKELVSKYPANGSSVAAFKKPNAKDYGYIYSKIKVFPEHEKKIEASLSIRLIQKEYSKFLIKAGLVKYDPNQKYTQGLVAPIFNSKDPQNIIAFQKIPHNFKGDKKFRGQFKANGAGFWITPDGWSKKKDNKSLYVVESFINALSLGMYGFNVICAFSANNTDFLPEFFKEYEKVIVLFDNDPEGKTGASKLSQNIGIDKTFILAWPKETPDKFDVNDLLMKDPANFETELEKLLKNMKPAKDLIKPITKEKRQAKNFNAHEILVKLDLKNYLTVPNVGFYLYMPEGFWQEIERLYVESKIKEIIGEPTRYEISETSKMLELDTLIPRGRELNEQKWMLNLKNGMMNVETGGLKSHSRDLYSTIQLPVNYNPDSRCPQWEKFLLEVVEYPAVVAVLQEFIGLCLIPETKFHKALVLVGSGENGKSTLLAVLEHLLGRQNISNVPMGKLESEFHRASLFNKLVNISSELEISELMGSGYFKSIASGDTIDAAFKFRDSFSFTPYARLIFAMNDLPKSRDRSHGYYRRFLIVPFNKEFKGSQADRTLGKKLILELDGIFNWALAGLKRLFEQDHFTKSKVLDDMLKQYKRDNNPVISFLEDHCIINPNLSIEKNKIYETYKDDFCKNNGYKSFGNSQFFKELKRQVPQISESQPREDGVRIRILEGISLRNDG